MGDRDKKGRFAPGWRGGPGRPKGSRDKATVERERVLNQLRQQNEGMASELLKKAQEMALAGDTVMLKALLDRLYPVWSAKEEELLRRLDELEGRIAAMQGDGADPFAHLRLAKQ